MVAKMASLNYCDKLLCLETEIKALIGGRIGQVSPSPPICLHLGPAAPSNVTYTLTEGVV